LLSTKSSDHSWVSLHDVICKKLDIAVYQLHNYLTDLQVSGELLCIDEILKLHKNLKAMSILCNHFLLCVVEKMMENAGTDWEEGQ